jgi:hypothetical protein
VKFINSNHAVEGVMVGSAAGIQMVGEDNTFATLDESQGGDRENMGRDRKWPATEEK